MGFFEELYEQGYFPSEDARPEDIEGVRQARAKVTELAEKIVECLGSGGDELLEEYQAAKAAEVSYEIQTAFAQGAKFVGRVLMECCRK